MFGADHGVRAGDDEALEQVAQLAHIAGPGMREQELHGFGAYFFRRLVLGPTGFVKAHLDKDGYIFLAVAQRGDIDGDYIETVIEIFAKGVRGDGAFEIAVGRGDDAHLGAVDLRVAERLKLMGF